MDMGVYPGINVADASNLKRNLYLTFQLIEMEVPVIMALNMMDVAERRGIDIDAGALSQQLGIKVIPAAIKSGRGKKELLDAINESYEKENSLSPVKIDYGSLEPVLHELVEKIRLIPELAAICPPRWLSIKLMENDKEAKELVRKKCI